MSRRGWNRAALAGARRRGAGGEAPGVGGVTHPLQSAQTPHDGTPFDLPVYIVERAAQPAPPPVVEAEEAAAAPLVELDLIETPAGAAKLFNVGPIYAFSRADLVSVDPDAPVADVRPAAVRWGVPAPTPGAPVCVARGVDTLHLAIYAHIEEPRIVALLGLLKLARERGEDDPIFLAAGGFAWQVTWTKPPYAVALSCAAAHIRFMKTRRGCAPQVYVEVRSAMLWRDGLVAAGERLEVLIRSWEVPRPDPTKVEVSRLDLAADFQGLDFDGSELAAGRWVCRALARGGFNRAGKAAGSAAAKKARAAAARKDMEGDQEAATYQHGKTHTGGTFGVGSVKVRYYRKDIEIKKSGKHWMKAIWGAGGWDGAAPVWRVEAQLLGPALASMVATAKGATWSSGGQEWAPGAVSYGKSWRAVVRHLDAIWRYAVGDPAADAHGWLTLRDPGDAAQVTRWPVSAQWRAVQSVPFGQIAQVYGAETVEVARLASRVTAAHVEASEAALERGQQWRPEFVVEVDPAADATTIARAIDGPQALADWGPGPANKIEAAVLAAVGRQSQPPMDFDAMTAEARLAMLEDQLLGVARSFVVARDMRDRMHTDDPDEAARLVCARLVELIAADPDTWRTRTRGTLAKTSMRGAVAYRLEVAAAGHMVEPKKKETDDE